MPTTDGLRSERDALVTEAEEILARSEDTIVGPDRGRFDAITARIEELNGDLERRATLARSVTGPAVVAETGDGAAAVGNARTAQLVRHQDPAETFDRSGLSVERAADGMAYRDRALRAIEGWDRTVPAEHRESAEALIDHAPRSRRDRDVADHILRLGNPAYVDGFYEYLARPTAVNLFSEAQRAALNEGTTTQGGFLVPPMLDPTVILSNTGVSNPMRSIVTVKSVTTEVWKGISSAGITAEWASEAQEAADASPTFAQPTITPARADAWVQSSMEVMEDTSIGSDLASLFADARDRLEAAAWISGTGSSQPTGLVTDLNLTTASRVNSQTNGQFGAIDIFALDGALGPRWRNNGSWIASKGIYNLVRQMATGSGPMTGAFWSDLGGAQPPILLGYPAFENSSMINALSAATASNDCAIVIGDFRQYYVVDRIGASVLFEPMIMGSSRRPTGEVGWFFRWRTGGKAVVIDAFRSLNV